MSYIARRSFLLGVAGVIAAAFAPPEAFARASVSPPPLPPPIEVGQTTNWYIDPGNVTRNASDANDGHSRCRPLRTFRALSVRLPVVVTSSTTVTILSDAVDPNDAFSWSPQVVRGGLQVRGKRPKLELPRGTSSVRALARRPKARSRSR